MTLIIYVGHIPYANMYYINRRGMDFIDKDTKTFKDINLLLNHLTHEYEDRKALVRISEDIPKDVKEKILGHIREKVRKLQLDLKERVS